VGGLTKVFGEGLLHYASESNFQLI
jgi:hypothetical protein